eukprot:9064731-Ditylum_brightwellii.AAC.1
MGEPPTSVSPTNASEGFEHHNIPCMDWSGYPRSLDFPEMLLVHQEQSPAQEHSRQYQAESPIVNYWIVFTPR